MLVSTTILPPSDSTHNAWIDRNTLSSSSSAQGFNQSAWRATIAWVAVGKKPVMGRTAECSRTRVTVTSPIFHCRLDMAGSPHGPIRSGPGDMLAEGDEPSHARREADVGRPNPGGTSCGRDRQRTRDR